MVHSILHNGCTSFHSHQECRRAPFWNHPLPHVLFVDFLMMAILTSVKWYLTVVLIWLHHNLCNQFAIDGCFQSLLKMVTLYLYHFTTVSVPEHELQKWGWWAKGCLLINITKFCSTGIILIYSPLRDMWMPVFSHVVHQQCVLSSFEDCSCHSDM